MTATAADFLKNLLDALLPNRAAPVLGRVYKAHEGPGRNRYSVDVRVLRAGSLEETGRVIKEVPLSPIWASAKGRGVYAIPPEGQVVVVGFLEWDVAYPYVAGVWSDEYEAGEYRKDQFVIDDGKGMRVVVDSVNKTITIDNSTGTVVTLDDGIAKIDNGQFQVVLNGSKVALKNGSKSLYSVLKTHFQNVAGMTTVGSPSTHTVQPSDIAKINQDIAALGALLED